MRSRGARVGVGEVLTAHRALATVDLPDARDALRAVLCARREDLAAFDAAFAEVFDEAASATTLMDVSGAGVVLPRAGDPSTVGDGEGGELVPAAWRPL
jgi:uncharacterized protein with von Willebrand factor type A (vWA) domain